MGRLSNSQSTKRGVAQQVFEFPVAYNIIGRFIRFSGSGLYDEARKVTESDESDMARRSSIRKAAVADVVDGLFYKPGRKILGLRLPIRTPLDDSPEYADDSRFWDLSWDAANAIKAEHGALFEEEEVDALTATMQGEAVKLFVEGGGAGEGAAIRAYNSIGTNKGKARYLLDRDEKHRESIIDVLDRFGMITPGVYDQMWDLENVPEDEPEDEPVASNTVSGQPQHAGLFEALRRHRRQDNGTMVDLAPRAHDVSRDEYV